MNGGKCGRRWRWLWRLGGCGALAGLLYAAFLVLGFCPVNRNYTAPAASERVLLFIRSNEIHTDIVVPVWDEPAGIDWRELFPPENFQADVRGFSHVAVGWGNRGFYVETPRWSDLKLATVLSAIFPSEAVLHVEYVDVDSRDADLRELAVSRQNYRELAEFIRSTVGRRNAQGSAQSATEMTYGTSDRFYLASGHYHAFNTCNQWTGRGLKRAGVPIGIWTPLKQQVLCWLPPSASHGEQP